MLLKIKRFENGFLIKVNKGDCYFDLVDFVLEGGRPCR